MYIIFQDYFGGADIDGTKWSRGMFSPTSPEPSWTPTIVTNYFDHANSFIVDEGVALHLKKVDPSQVVNTHPYDWSGSAIQTNGKVMFNPPIRVSVNVRLPSVGVHDDKISNWPCAWLLGERGEIDIVEGLHGKAMYHFHTRPTDPAEGDGPGGYYDGNNAGAYHSFGVDWRVGKLEFRRNGKSIGAIRSPRITGDPMYMILSNTTGKFGGPKMPARVVIKSVQAWRLEKND